MKTTENCQLVATGQLRLYEKNTGQEICKNNLVVKNSTHIAVIGLGQDIVQREVRMVSWGDNFVETPSKTGYNWTKFEALEGDHSIDGNHTHGAINVAGHSYPSSRAIKFSFEFDRNNMSEMLGTNILEWGLFFNGVMFSRVALETDFVFQSWMTIVGEWTIILSNCAGGFGNFYLNQYDIASIWSMQELLTDGNLEDFGGTNHLSPTTPAQGILLARDMIGTPDVNDTALWPENSLTTLYPGNSVRVLESDNDGALDLRDGQFTLWQWFNIVDSDKMDSHFTLFSKWANIGTVGDRSYRLRLHRVLGIDYLSFDLNDNGSIITLTSSALDLDADSTIGIENAWNLCALRLDYTTQTLEMILNGNVVASTVLTSHGVTPLNNTTFYIGNEHYDVSAGSTSVVNAPQPYGFLAETGISKEIFSDQALDLLWNQGNGSFYIP